MVNRYGYTWEYLTTSGGGFDDDGNPIQATETWVPFECDIQPGLGGGSFVTGPNGDNINVTYSIFTKLDTGLISGGRVRDESQKEFTVLQIRDMKLNFEIWV